MLPAMLRAPCHRLGTQIPARRIQPTNVPQSRALCHTRIHVRRLLAALAAQAGITAAIGFAFGLPAVKLHCGACVRGARTWVHNTHALASLITPQQPGATTGECLTALGSCTKCANSTRAHHLCAFNTAGAALISQAYLALVDYGLHYALVRRLQVRETQ